jgi:lyso-ornithine lipid O-acyltransferase
MGSTILAVFRLTAFLLWTGALIPAQVVAVALGSRWAERIPLLYHRVCCRIVGMRVRVLGAMSTERPVLFVSNHSSYLDVVTLGSVIPGCFVAKSEVRSWPLFGLLARLQRSAFVERRARSTAGRQRDDLQSRLEAGDNLILFPEGTSSDGNRTLPFKSTLFAAAALRPGGKPLLVQPVSVTPTLLDGIPMGSAFRTLYSWYGDMDLAPHLWTAFREGTITVDIEFHPPVTLEQFGTRKTLAEHCWKEVAHGVARAVSGRPRPEPAALTEPKAG